MSVDQNLIYGILALQMDYLSREALCAAISHWAAQKDKSLGQILLERQALDKDQHALLEELVQKHLNQHHHDATLSLVALFPPSQATRQSGFSSDPDVRTKLGSLTSQESEAGARPWMYSTS